MNGHEIHGAETKTMKTPGTTAWLVLLLGDIAAFLLFTCIGKQAHHLPVHFAGVLGTAAPFLFTWIGAGGLLGVYRPDAYAGIKRSIIVTLKAWTVAGPLAILIRSILLQTPITLMFATVAYAIMLAFLLGWRVSFAFLHGWLRRYSRT
jgi:hypothetical protein